jgi:ADP-ribose pyrophosphatase
MPQDVTSVQRIFNGDYLQLERRMVRLPDGTDVPREIVVVKNAIAALPIHEDGTVVMVRQFRPAVGEDLLEIPAGVIDPGETPEDAVRRELKEEIGFHPVTIRHLFDYYHAEGYSTGVLHLYLALGLTDAGGPAPDHGEILEVETLHFDEAYRRVIAGQFHDSKSLLSIMRVAELRRLGQVSFP